jgi:hypothetical protein
MSLIGKRNACIFRCIFEPLDEVCFLEMSMTARICSFFPSSFGFPFRNRCARSVNERGPAVAVIRTWRQSCSGSGSCVSYIWRQKHDKIRDFGVEKCAICVVLKVRILTLPSEFFRKVCGFCSIFSCKIVKFVQLLNFV